MLTLGKERLSGRVSVEDIPSGHRHLTTILEAMTEGVEIRIIYKKYTSSEESTYTLRPYAVKEFAKRWYVIGHCLERNALRVYGLDRVMSIDMTGETFRMPAGFDVDELFATSFGIYLPEESGKTIIFRTSQTEARFLRDLPIHPSQKELKNKELMDACLKNISSDEVCFSIFVCPNENLTMEFCKYAGRVEVLSPASVREAVAEQLNKGMKQYSLDVRKTTSHS
jgi:predicted DNA-binding transcriptional regulator YafY